MEKKNILITGASGFIGSFMVDEALKQGYNVWAGVRTTSSGEFLEDERIRFMALNYANEPDFDSLASQLSQLDRIDYIIHCAGITKSKKQAEFNKINFRYTANLVEAINQLGYTPDKFILMSSLSVMGSGDETGLTPFDTASIANPNTAYGASKLRAERYLQEHSNFPYIILRPTGVYGPREKDYLMMIKAIKAGLDVKAGMKPQHLTFIYVQDLVDATFLALTSSVSNKEYFVSDGKTYLDDEYTDLINKELGEQSTLRFRIPLCLLKMVCVLSEFFAVFSKGTPTLNRDKYKIMKQRNWKCDISPIISDLGFAPKYSLSQGLEESIAWYKKNGWL